MVTAAVCFAIDDIPLRQHSYRDATRAAACCRSYPRKAPRSLAGTGRTSAAEMPVRHSLESGERSIIALIVSGTKYVTGDGG